MEKKLKLCKKHTFKKINKKSQGTKIAWSHTKYSLKLTDF